MSGPRAELVIAGQVLLAATPDGLSTADAIAIGGGRVVAAGTREDVRAVTPPAVPELDVRDAAVIPGLHDFHLHLVGMARRLREVDVGGVSRGDLVRAVETAFVGASPAAWLRGRGWGEVAMDRLTVRRLNELLADRPALFYSHDAHSAWASPGALRLAGVGAGTDDPPGGRIERDAAGAPNGVLRERATDLVERVAQRLSGSELDAALGEVLAELAAWGVTGATDAGDTTADNGVGEYAALGDRASLLLAAHPRLDGRLRLAIGFPAEAIDAAAELGLRTGIPLPGTDSLRIGWAKAYADGALGSRTAALFEPYTCGDTGDTGILRLDPDEMDELVQRARRSRIGMAVHAIGDRAAAAVLDALQRGPERSAGVPPDRLEHLQLLRPIDRGRLSALDVTASVQPVHCAADRRHVEECWSDRVALSYPWGSLRDAGVRLAFGSDAPIETASPWDGLFAAVHRRAADDGTADWQTHEALSVAGGLAGYTTGPAAAAVRPDEGHLHPGAVADLAVLDVDLATLLAADERLAAVRSVLTLFGGREVHRS